MSYPLLAAEASAPLLAADADLPEITIPAGLAAGAYYVIGRVRHLGSITDPDLANNAAARSGVIAVAAIARTVKRALAGDFDGDRKADPGIYQANGGVWYVRLSGSAYSLVWLAGFGSGWQEPVSGDYDGDGKTDLVIYDALSATWSFRLSAASYGLYSIGFDD